MWITIFDGGRVYLYNDCNDMERVIITSIIRTGNSLCVVIPKNILKALKLERGDQVAFGIYNENTLTITKLNPADIKTWKT